MTECKSGNCQLGGSDEMASSQAGNCSCGCGSKGACPSCICGTGKIEEFIGLAVSAHHELLKQKMKAAFEAKIGRKMDKVAEVVVDAALLSLKDKMAEKKAHKSFEEKIMSIFDK